MQRVMAASGRELVISVRPLPHGNQSPEELKAAMSLTPGERVLENANISRSAMLVYRAGQEARRRDA